MSRRCYFSAVNHRKGANDFFIALSMRFTWTSPLYAFSEDSCPSLCHITSIINIAWLIDCRFPQITVQLQLVANNITPSGCIILNLSEHFSLSSRGLTFLFDCFSLPVDYTVGKWESALSLSSLFLSLSLSLSLFLSLADRFIIVIQIRGA